MAKLVRGGCCCALALALAMGVGAQDLNKVVTFRSNAKTADALLAEFGKQVGLTITVSDEVRLDVVAVRFEGVTLDEALKRIAATLRAEWNARGAFYHLVRTKKTAFEVRQADFARRAEGFQKTLESLRPEVVGGPLTARLLKSIPPADLAALAPGGRAYWCVWVDHSRRTNPFNQRFIDYASEWPMKPSGLPVGGPLPAKYLDYPPNGGYFVVRRPLASEGVSVQAVAVNKPGIILVTNTFWIAPTPEEAPPGGAASASEGERPISLTPEAKEGLGWFGPSLGVGIPVVGGDALELACIARVPKAPGFNVAAPKEFNPPMLSEKARERLLNPERYEPLGTFPSEGFMAAAEGLKVSMVAYLPDSVLGKSGALFAAGSVLPSRFLAAARDWGLEVQVADGWMTVCPSRLAACWDARVDRRALGKALRTCATKGFLSLDDLAAYALGSPTGNFPMALDAACLSLVCPSEAHAILAGVYGPERDALRFWGCLSAQQKRALESGGGLAVQQLADNARSEFHSLLFNSEPGPAIGYSLARPGYDLYHPYSMGAERTCPWYSPPIEAGTLAMRASRAPAVKAFGPAGSASATIPLGELALLDGGASGAQYERYEPGLLTTLRFHYSADLHIERMMQISSDGIEFDLFMESRKETIGPFMADMDWTLQDSAFNPDLAAKSYSNLPAEFHRAVTEARRQVTQGAGRRDPN